MQKAVTSSINGDGTYQIAHVEFCASDWKEQARLHLHARLSGQPSSPSKRRQLAPSNSGRATSSIFHDLQMHLTEYGPLNSLVMEPVRDGIIR